MDFNFVRNLLGRRNFLKEEDEVGLNQSLAIDTKRDVDYKPFWIDDNVVKKAMSYGLLFADTKEDKIAIASNKNISNALFFYSKMEDKLPLFLVDDASFDRLMNKFMEIRTHKMFSSFKTETETSGDLFEAESEMLEFLKNSQDLLSSEESAPIIKLVNSLFFQAINKNASDIHVEVHELKGEVRFRIDGALTKHIDLSKNITNFAISRIKVISNLDISEKRIPQDGRTQIKIAGRSLDVRVSVLPTYYGERVVMRILMQSESIPSLKNLGFNKEITKSFHELLNHSHGMILVTGPTGSGKSTTLHSFLQYVATPDKNIITIEDPVEYNAPNINQIQVNTKAGLTFASGLRSILRQDPDVVMLGEIRDSETAQIATQSALTGHLVFSTLHTNNSTSSITRLLDMNIDSFLISSTLLGVLAQRLVRLVCPECKEESSIAKELSETMQIDSNQVVYKAKGCPHCSFTGYRGRSAIGELFVIDDDIRSMIKNSVSDFEIRENMKKIGMQLLPDILKCMLLKGKTSLEEVLRIGILDG